MQKRRTSEYFKNAVGTVFLMAAAFFMCSTFLSMRSVLADPIAPTVATGRANIPSPRTGRTAVGASRAGGAVTPQTSRTVASRATNSAPSRAVSARTNTTTSRSTPSRTVRSRVAANGTSRVALTGAAIGASRISGGTTVSTLSNRLYTGNYATIVDPSTGLISADAYSNCLDSYYTCMDEICTARNAEQGRCACAGRVLAFAEAQTALETANEELIKVSGELALLIANKGKDVSAAFTLTEAEQVMNCVSWKEENGRIAAMANTSDKKAAATEWCENHMIFTECANDDGITMPTYCKPSGNTFDLDVDMLTGSGSDIFARLAAYAKAKESTLTFTTYDNTNLVNAIKSTDELIVGLTGSTNTGTAKVVDSLAETWGYELFEYAHNNVCNRVLDSCFNGIYEACGTPTGSDKCANGRGQCPYNYNHTVSVVHNNSGEYNLNFITPSGYTNANSASCFGYSSTLDSSRGLTQVSSDPYSSLRVPVADARRSIMQKYALDANASCDVFGEKLRTTAQNIAYQKEAARQALQQKRQEFANEETASARSRFTVATDNFNECISEIYDCYNTQKQENAGWPKARVKAYCHTVASIPHCYEEMVCSPSNSQIKMVVDVADHAPCNISLSSDSVVNGTQNYACRNVTTLYEILNGLGVSPGSSSLGASSVREKCLSDMGADAIRDWAF